MSDEQSCFDVAAKAHNLFELNQERPNVLVVTCSEPQAMNTALIADHVGSVKMVEADGGMAGLDSKLDATKDSSENWLLREVEKSPEVGLVLFCGHYGCKHLPTREQNVVLFAGSGEHCYSLLEATIWREVHLLRSALAQQLPDSKLAVSGCVYDPEYDWLSVYDEETRLFLPVNAHRFRVSPG